MFKNIFRICSYIQKMTPNPINTLKITIYNTKHTKHTNTHLKTSKNHKTKSTNVGTFRKIQTNQMIIITIYQISIIHILYILYILYTCNCLCLCLYLYLSLFARAPPELARGAAWTWLPPWLCVLFLAYMRIRCVINEKSGRKTWRFEELSSSKK